MKLPTHAELEAIVNAQSVVSPTNLVRAGWHAAAQAAEIERGILLTALRSVRRQCDKDDVRREVIDRALVRVGVNIK